MSQYFCLWTHCMRPTITPSLLPLEFVPCLCCRVATASTQTLHVTTFCFWHCYALCLAFCFGCLLCSTNSRCWRAAQLWLSAFAVRVASFCYGLVCCFVFLFAFACSFYVLFVSFIFHILLVHSLLCFCFCTIPTLLLLPLLLLHLFLPIIAVVVVIAFETLLYDVCCRCSLFSPIAKCLFAFIFVLYSRALSAFSYSPIIDVKGRVTASVIRRV